MEEFEAQCFCSFQDPVGGSFQRLRFFRSSCFDLEVGQQIMCEGYQLLPRIVRPVMVCGDGVQSQSVLELADDFLVHAAATHKAPERPDIQLQVGRDSGVFPGAIVGVKEVQLVVLLRFVENTFRRAAIACASGFESGDRGSARRAL